MTTRLPSDPCLIVALILLSLFSLPSSASSQVTLFSDDFSSGNADSWQVIDFGEFSVEEERLCVATVCAP